MDFNCTGDLCSVAHSAADTGGEFVATYQVDIGFESPTSWIVPTDDLVSIYKIRCVFLMRVFFPVCGALLLSVLLLFSVLAPTNSFCS